MGTSPSFDMMNVFVPVSLTGQKPKSRLVGTLLEMVGVAALMGTTNDPFSVINSMQSSYASRRIGRNATCAVGEGYLESWHSLALWHSGLEREARQRIGMGQRRSGRQTGEERDSGGAEEWVEAVRCGDGEMQQSKRGGVEQQGKRGSASRKQV